MEVLALSQRQKITLFLVVLSIGFICLGLFTSNRLSIMSSQYQSSGDVAAGSISIHKTQSELLALAADLDSLTSNEVDRVKNKIDEIKRLVASDSRFLKELDLSLEADTLTASVEQFYQTLVPWLEVKAELGFNVDEGKLGQLKSLAATIEMKIEETGMVTLNSDFQAMIKAQQNYLLQPNEKNLKLFNRAMAGFVNMSNTYAMLDLYEKEIEVMKATFMRVAELSQQLGSIEQSLFQSESRTTSVIKDVTGVLAGITTEYEGNAQRSASQTQWSVLIACALLAIFTIAIFITISTTLTRSVKQTGLILSEVAKGDLAQRMVVGGNANDEFNQLAMTINQSCENLGELVQGVQQSSNALSENAAELNSGIDSLVHNQSKVLGQTELLASATEEVSVTTQEVSNSLEFVADISKSSTLAAEEGSTVIKAAIDSLEDVNGILQSAAGHIQQLEAASSKVDSVMEIINGIAEQTNLLALNAAIEAARAGEQGRGFAVVADEVRNLAVRTVDAVGEISGTIETMKKESAEVIQYIGQSESSIHAGQDKGHEAMEALSQITEKADDAAHQTEVIFASIRELATTSQSMANNMIEISSAMKELEHNNEQLRQTSQLVEQRSNSLNSDCDRFNI
ncbi:methyl-accepting chemotaxis protein [Vibrio sp. ZSDE26]|uniref:Methyl-accepting chemotaxis protein n=1 Tax=Vibrio amylolyticus TaxID=2847292 RepID=A0A9X2BKG8_9VIBR|nr:methyl-accepting chemotaxis protein [Vibrio amylolyticus]MCK6262823.1 methyl-accepting chemotaxis protein [Vibrio amylolyticus]